VDRILISGASGLIGQALATSLELGGAEVVRLVRNVAQSPKRDVGKIPWDPLVEGVSPHPSEVSGFYAVIHLAGESIAGRWTEKKKRAIRESRVRGTRNLAAALANSEPKPHVFLCASAIGFYGDGGEEVLTEDTPNGKGFLPEVCHEWEEASQTARQAGIRTVNLRTGLVLSAKGGALSKMLIPFKLGLGGRIGSGKQWWSWIHLDDMVGAVHHIVQTESLSGPVNMVAPNPVRNTDFTKVLASVLGRPAIFPVPGFALAMVFGRMAADELFLSSQRVEPRRLAASGYRFQFSDLRATLASLV